MFGNYIREFEEDPFFSFNSERLRGMDESFPSFFFPSSDPLCLTDDDRRGNQSKSRRAMVARPRDQMIRSDDYHRGGPRDPFESVQEMMNNIQRMMGNLSMETMAANGIQNDQDGQFYSQSSVMSYSNVDGGQPKIYQATTASRQLPGGLRETRKAVRDSEAGLEKMALGRHINERGNVITRQRNTRTGDFDENKDFINMDENDLPHFDNEWQEKTQRYYRGLNSIGQQQGQQTNRRALDNCKAKHRKVPAVDSALRESKHHRSSRHQ